MNSLNNLKAFVSALAMALVSSAAAPCAVIFSDDFSGTGGTDLNGSLPDVTTGGAAWVAAPVFNQDGEIDPGPGSATLAFTPANGLIYTLDVSMTGLVYSGSGNTADWLAIGFSEGQSTAADTNSRFITTTVIGKIWMLSRGDQATGDNQAFLGSATSGTANGIPWAGGPGIGGDFDLRLVLDTTGGAGSWTATWFAKRPADASFTEVRATAPLLNENINSVGIASSNGGVDGRVTRFSLTSVPEPSAAALIGIAAIALYWRRR
ncbi:MAG: PEP-CTERM sorting domain-containing protein [Verrucomicrobiales bacterium]